MSNSDIEAEEGGGEKYYSSQTLVNLRQLCKERGLKVGGKKQDIIDRLLDYDDEINNNGEDDNNEAEDASTDAAAVSDDDGDNNNEEGAEGGAVDENGNNDNGNNNNVNDETSTTAIIIPDNEIGAHDLLFGKGGATNRNPGNIEFRRLLKKRKDDYKNASKADKPGVSRAVVLEWRNMGGRVLQWKKDAESGDVGWCEVDDTKARQKTSQCFGDITRPKQKEKREYDMKVQTARRTALQIAQGLMLENGGAGENEEQEDAQSNKNDSPDHLQDKENVGSTTMERISPSAGDEEAASLAQQFKSKSTQSFTKPEEGDKNDSDHGGDVGKYSTSVDVRNDNEVVTPHSNEDDDGDNTNHKEEGEAQEGDSGGPIEPRESDILFGRGGYTNNHPGNKRFHDVVAQYRSIYHTLEMIDKPIVSKLIVSELKGASPPSRFLEMNDKTGEWELVEDRHANEKVSQALRERFR